MIGLFGSLVIYKHLNMMLICHLWIASEGLGSSRNGIADPIMAGNVKLDNLGIGAHWHGNSRG